MTSGQISGTFVFEYDRNGQQTKITMPNGQTRNFTYDNQGRLTRLTNLHGSTVLGAFDYEYDKNNATGQFTALGQRTRMTADVPAISTLQVATEYQYDPSYQLTSTKTFDTTTVQRSWTYDAIGNRLSQTVGGNVTSYTYVRNGVNANNGFRLATAGTESITHDYNGNITKFGAVTYTWDVLDRMKSRNTGSTLNFQYDAQNRRVGIDHQSTKYIYNGLDPVAVSYTKNNGYYLAYYLYGPGIDQPLARVDYQGATYYVVDGMGSVVALNDSAGTVKNKYAYGTWGEPTTVTEQVVQPFAYTGREFATLDSGLVENEYYYRMRYMKPAMGRFFSEDPIQQFLPIEGAAVYSYVENQPTMFADPHGLQKCSISLEWGGTSVQTEIGQEWVLSAVHDLPKVFPVSPTNFAGKILGASDKAVGSSGTTMERCIWTRFFVSTKYLLKKWSIIEKCECPDYERVYNGVDKIQISQNKSKTGSAVTYGTIGLGGYNPCGKPN
jgi:RHS repeat-associated protein